MIYLASPHAHHSYQVRYVRYIQVVQYTAWMMDNGINVFSPIAHSKIISTFRNVKNNDFSVWKDFDIKMLLRCDDFGILMLDGWIESIGVRDEKIVARDTGIAVRYFEYRWMSDYPELLKMAMER